MGVGGIPLGKYGNKTLFISVCPVQILAYQDFEQGESEAEDILQVWDGWTNEDDDS